MRWIRVLLWKLRFRVFGHFKVRGDNHGNPWSAQDDLDLAMLPLYGYEDFTISGLIGRTERAIQQRRYYLSKQ